MVDLTEQQKAMVEAAAGRRNIVGSARAGTGKSFTATQMANALVAAHPGATGVLAVYNKEAAISMEGKLPPGFEARTTHSLAYQIVGYQYQHRIKPPKDAKIIAPWLLGKYMGLPKKSRLTLSSGAKADVTDNAVAMCVLRTIRNYCSDATPEIFKRHVSLPDLARRNDNPGLTDLIMSTARYVWANDCINPRGIIRYNHDWYLKQWGQDIIESGKWAGYDAFYVDEGQDSTNLIKGVFEVQIGLGCHGVVIGDPYQAIYEWRGARNIMGDLAEAGIKELMLTQSFRFGDVVAEEGRKWLTLAGGRPDLVGTSSIPSRLGGIDRGQPYAVLCRTNAGCAREVLAAHDAGMSVGTRGNLAQVIGLMKAAMVLRGGRQVDHPLLAPFEHWSDLVAHVDSDLCDAQELRLVCSLMRNGDAGRVIAALEASKHTRDPHVTVATAHSTKGMEWEQVVIGPDWTRPKPDPVTGETVIPRDLARLAYVAVTRARGVLDRGGSEVGLGWVDEYV